MDLVKKNLSSILCGLVALLAIGAWLYPTGGWKDDLQKKLDDSKKNYNDKITSLMGTTRRMPQVYDPANPDATAPVLLTPDGKPMYPTPKVVEAGDKFKQKVTEQSSGMLSAVVELNRHTPIVQPFLATNMPDSWVFKRAYLRWIGQQETTDDPNAVTVKTVLQGVVPPNDDEVQAEKNRIWKEQFENKIYKIDDKEQNRKEVEQQFEQATANLTETMRRQRAEQFKVYLDPDALEYHPKFAPTASAPATIEEIWYAQNMLWIDQDVANAIKRINDGAKNIMDAPIKQLIKVSMSSDFNQYAVFRPPAAPGASALAPDAPPPPPDDSAMAGKAYGMNETGRVCNPLYDVIKFHVEMNVDAQKIPLILAELQRGRLVTVWSVDAIAVDARAAVTDGYVYGTAPIAHLSLECEELFMRGWTVNGKGGPMMPTPVQTRLGISPGTAQ